MDQGAASSTEPVAKAKAILPQGALNFVCISFLCDFVVFCSQDPLSRATQDSLDVLYLFSMSILHCMFRRPCPCSSNGLAYIQGFRRLVSGSCLCKLFAFLFCMILLSFAARTSCQEPPRTHWMCCVVLAYFLCCVPGGPAAKLVPTPKTSGGLFWMLVVAFIASLMAWQGPCKTPMQHHLNGKENYCASSD